LRIFLLALTLSTSTRGVVMIYLLFLLIPIVALLAWAARLDWKRRRRGISGHDINTAAYTARQDAERKNTEWTLNVTRRPGRRS
jgi:Na+-transporting methylmalonyl-CoA/oxaloacetate decarboxylase gamma subunit